MTSSTSDNEHEYPYLDPSLSAADRVADLLPRLSLEDKAGIMFHSMITSAPLDSKGGPIPLPSGREYLDLHRMNHFNLLGGFDGVESFCDWINTIQKAAAETKWKIPITMSTDPKHAFNENIAFSMSSGLFSSWPEHIGMAALADEKRMEEFADIVRQEYVAVGLRAALHPQADLSTEYQWARIAGGLGEDADLAAKLCAAHIRGLQQTGDLGPGSVSACVKHFPGGAPAKNGLDPHFAWGAEQIYPGDNFEYHLKPFTAAIAEECRVLMPSYAKPMGTKYEEVSMAFNKGILTDLLQEEMGFKGTVLSDWALLTNGDEKVLGDFAARRAWGLESLTREELVIRALDAGIDQFGGEHCTDAIIQVVNDGRVSVERIDRSVAKLLKDKFDLGLFEHRYVDVERAKEIVGKKEFVEKGNQAQRDSLTMVKNGAVRDENGGTSAILPLKTGGKVYLEGFKSPLVSTYGTSVDNPKDADVAIIRLNTPFEQVGSGFLTDHFHHGSMEFPTSTLEHIADIARTTPVIVLIYADRPPVLSTIDESATAILLMYGASEENIHKVLFGGEDNGPKGKLPFDLPRSLAAIKAAKSDVPFDTENPVYRFGHGLRY